MGRNGDRGNLHAGAITQSARLDARGRRRRGSQDAPCTVFHDPAAPRFHHLTPFEPPFELRPGDAPRTGSAEAWPDLRGVVPRGCPAGTAGPTFPSFS